MTAAHCLYESTDSQIGYDSVIVKLGITNLDNHQENDKNDITLRVSRKQFEKKFESKLGKEFEKNLVSFLGKSSQKAK